MLCSPLLSHKSCFFPSHSFPPPPQCSKLKSYLHTSYIFLPTVPWCCLSQEIAFLGYTGSHSPSPSKIGLLCAGLYLSQFLKCTACPYGTVNVVWSSLYQTASHLHHLTWLSTTSSDLVFNFLSHNDPLSLHCHSPLFLLHSLASFLRTSQLNPTLSGTYKYYPTCTFPLYNPKPF